MNQVDCSKVMVKESNFSTEDNKIAGAFAKVDIKSGELIEKGLMRRLSSNDDKSFNQSSSN